MRRKDMMERITQVASRTGEPILKQPLLEICGGHRVLIEHHSGVGEYSRESVSVKVRFGTVRIGGKDLKICRMTAEQLVIIGEIVTVEFVKGEGK